MSILNYGSVGSYLVSMEAVPVSKAVILSSIHTNRRCIQEEEETTLYGLLAGP